MGAEARTTVKPKVIQLHRLERLLDVVYALVVWRLFMLLPRPNDDAPQWDSIPAMLRDEWLVFVVALVGLLIVAIYWLQTHRLFGRLTGTDGKHTTLTIFQLFCLLLFLYAIGTGLRFGASPMARTFESLMAALVGLAALASWRYAAGRGNLVDPSMSPEEIKAVTQENMAEPLTALITIPFAFVGPWMWEASWFLYPGIRYLLRRRRQRG